MGAAGPTPDTLGAQRRQAAIVSVDVVGYSTMIASEFDLAVRTIRRYHDEIVTPALQAHQGSLIWRAGDAWLGEFETAAQAVGFAVALQAGVALDAPLPLRAGIDFGEIISDGTTLHGGAINVAVRLQGIARPGGITLSAAVRERLDPEPGCRLREIGPRVVKNIPDPVLVYRIVTRADEQAEATGPSISTIDLTHPVRGFGDRPAIAVLPFDASSGRPEHAYFSEGLAEDVIAGLSRLRWFPVIARNSSFSFRDPQVDVREVGRRLNARYIVSGTVLFGDERLRVHAALTEADKGHVVWSARYDRDAHDIPAFQDEIARGIVAAIEPEFSRAEQSRSRARSLDRLDDWGLVRRALWHMNRLTREDAAVARRLLDQVLSDDPQSIEALVHLAWWHFWDGWTRRGSMEDWVEMERLARRAMALDRQDARAAMLVGIAQFMQGETEHGRIMLERAIRLNPSLAIAYASIGSIRILLGEPEEAIEPLQTALRLSPNDFYVFHTLGEVATARAMMGDLRRAVAAAEESLQLRSGYVHAHVVRIGALARLGEERRARAALDSLLSRRPTFSVGDVAWLPFLDRSWVRYLTDGLRLAGFQEAH
jgi:adenylate cyclase